MAAILTSKPEMVDLSGLPEPLIENIQRLVQSLLETTPEVAAQYRETGESVFLSRPKPSAEEMERLLDEFSANPVGVAIPPDFSRADIYDDHD